MDARDADHESLRRTTPPDYTVGSGAIAIADLFCGVGGMTLGAMEAARSLGLAAECRLAVDRDAAALAGHAANFPGDHARGDDVAEMFGRRPDARKTATERRLARETGPLDLLLGGPPCQGHSDLNNFSRRDDPKNALYLCMARAAAVLEPRHVVIENVAGAAHDRGGVVDTTVAALDRLGYRVEVGLVDALRIGVPQRRRRLIVVASRDEPPSIDDLHEKYETEPRDLRWAIGDLEDEPATSPFTTPSTPSPDNRRRIAHLFEHDLFDLPDAERPPCHRDKPHTYRSVYGRLRWDEPPQTITSGFYSTCMGRYVHPSRPRTLTAHEAARIQFFPDFFDFGPCGNRTALARVIGNAVPSRVAYAVVRELLATGDEDSRAVSGRLHAVPVA